MNIISKTGASALLALSLAGCTFPIANGADQLPQMNNRFPIKVEPQVASMVVPVGMDGALQARDVDRVRAFAEIWKARGYGQLSISAEGASAGDASLREVRALLAAANIPDASVRVSAQGSGQADKATSVVLTYMTDKAVAESCDANWSENIGEEPRNLPWRDFACASQQNLAALLEDPRDLIEPREQDPADAMRRGTVLDKYRKGEPTAAQTDSSQEGGTVSDVAKE